MELISKQMYNVFVRQELSKKMNQYILQSKLGQGAFSVVYKVQRKEDGQEYAMKKMRIMSFSQKEIANCLNQVRILASIYDQHVLDYKDSFFDEFTNTFCIVTEFLEGGDLAHLISKQKKNSKPLSQSLIWQVALHALKGLRSLHTMNIFHRDVKSANIFLTKDQQVAKLGDMNVSVISANGLARTQTGTPYYASPEVWNEKPYTSKCDIWSLGCVLYEMATLNPPFTSNNLRTLKKSILSGLYKKIPSSYSPELQNLIQMCLRVNPRERPSADALLEHLEVNKHFNTITDSTSSSFKILEKIQAPKKREFRIIKERLPRSRFSLEKKTQNTREIVDKENISNQSVNRTKIAKKKQNLPSLKRPISVDRITTHLMKKEAHQVAVIQPVGRPLPKSRILIP